MTETFKFRGLDSFTLADVEAVRLLLRGSSVIDWHRLNFGSEQEISDFIAAQELHWLESGDIAWSEDVKERSMEYLKRSFNFPIPKTVAQKNLAELLTLASAKGHKQLCACAILKVMHIIHHLDARELLFLLPISDEEVFRLVEHKVYRVVGAALAAGYPIVEFIGGRKNRDSLYTKLLSKREVSAAQIYDKVRFRIVTRSITDVFQVISYLQSYVFPFNFVIPGQSTNTLIDFRGYCEERPTLARFLPDLQIPLDREDGYTPLENRFTAPDYRVVHFVADMPIRVSDELLSKAPAAAGRLGKIVFVQTEFQILDEATDRDNELGSASHSSYKERQRLAVIDRLKVGKPIPEDVEQNSTND